MPRTAQSMKLAIQQGNPNNIDKKMLTKRLKNEEKFDIIGTKNLFAPDWLSEDEKAIFSKIKKRLKPIGLLNDLDVSLLARFSATYNKYIQVNSLINDEGIKTEEGKINPLLKEFSSLDKMLSSLSNELALTPSARSSLSLALAKDSTEEGDDEFDD